MTIMEEKLFAALWSHASDDELMAARTQAERELAPYRGKMSGPQIDQFSANTAISNFWSATTCRGSACSICSRKRLRFRRNAE